MGASKLVLLLALTSLFSASLAEYVIKTNGTSCLIMDIEADIEIKYLDTKGIGRSVYVQWPNNVTNYAGDCITTGKDDNPVARLRVILPDSSTLNVTFMQVDFEEQGESVSIVTLHQVSYEYDTTKNKDFVDPAFKGVTRASVGDLLIRLHHLGHHYTCRRNMEFDLYPNVIVNMRWIKAQAIDIVNNTYSQEGEECPNDPPVTSTTTLATTTTQAYGDKYYVIAEDGTVCLVVQFNATFKIPYLTMSGNDETATVPFNPYGVILQGRCGEENQNLTMQWRPVTSLYDPLAQPWYLTFAFSRLESEKENAEDFSLSKIILNYQLINATFPNTANESLRVIALSESDDRFKTPVGDAYRCNSDRDVKLTDAGLKMDTSNFKAEAFRKSKTTDFSTNESVCSEDIPPTPAPSTKNIVLIVVGVVLAVLVVIAIIAFFIYRHRQRKNYQQLE